MNTIPQNLLSLLGTKASGKSDVTSLGQGAQVDGSGLNQLGSEVQSSGENFDILLANLLPEAQSEQFLNSAEFSSPESIPSDVKNQKNSDINTLEILKQLKSPEQKAELENVNLKLTQNAQAQEVTPKDVLKSLLNDAKLAKSEATNQTKELFSLFKNDPSVSDELLLEGETIKNSADENILESFLGKTNEKSKIGLSGDDFLMTLKNQKQLKNELQSQKNLESDKSNPLTFLKDYTHKQNVLNNNVIHNTHDLAFKEGRSKASVDELTMPEMKIGAELSTIKESFIPVINNQNSNQSQDASVATKTLDLSKINASNPSALINEISNYIQQAQFANMETIDLAVKHDDLGQFNIQVNRNADAKGDLVGLQITTTTQEGHEFFSKHEVSLLKNLSFAGVQITDLKIVNAQEAMGFAQSDSKNSNQSFNGQQQRNESMNFSQNSSDNGSQRRRELWEEARQNSFRYGA